MPHKPRPLLRRFWRRFRRGLVTGLMTSVHVAAVIMMVFVTGSVLGLFLDTGKTSIAIIFFALVFGAGMLAIALAIRSLKFTVNTTLHADYIEVASASPTGRAAAQLAARKH
jgi:hypothetical protein